MNKPTKGHWFSEVKKWVFEYEIATTFKELKHMKKKHYEKIPFEKVQIEAFQYKKI